jgi:hypothetical protein
MRHENLYDLSSVDLDHGLPSTRVQARFSSTLKGQIMRTGLITITFTAILGVQMGCTPASMPEPDEGRAFFADNCTACHGATAQGGGPVGARDLSTLAQNNGGTFPRAQALAYIYGDPEQAHLARIMPQFGGAMAEDLVPIEIDGVMTPTPRVLAALLSYLESIQDLG